MRGMAATFPFTPCCRRLPLRRIPPCNIAVQTRTMLTLHNINEAVKKAEYAVRGEIPIKAELLRQQLHDHPESSKELGFDQVIHANIGNPQQLGQKGLTFLRQVAALTEYPDLLSNDLTSQLFPSDAIDRARKYIEEIGSIGAYTHSKGVPQIRRRVAKFIEERDGFPADPERIYLTSGASAGVETIMDLLIANPKCGVLIPIPQYPLYTAALALHKAVPCPYYLDESNDWSVTIQDIKSSLQKARSEGTDVRAIVVINPGNPTGSCLSESQVADILQFAHEEKLVVLADEVYQKNVFDPQTRGFHSFKKVLRSQKDDIASSVELFSFHSTSKGQIGECGRRGGYFEVVNVSDEVEAQIYKLASIQLCSPVAGQIAVDIMVDPPKEGEPSYKQFHEEIDGIQNSLKSRSSVLHKTFQDLEGVSCSDAQGAMYLFPTIRLPEKAVKEAEKNGRKPDAFYCMRLLEKTGICIVPGSGFGQREGTLHFRTTFLAPQIEEYSASIKRFHSEFMDEYR